MSGPSGDRPTPEELLAFVQPIRHRVEAIFEEHQVDNERAAEILSHAWVAVTLSKANDEQRRKLFLAAVESACRELRAELGPIEEQEDEPYVH